MPWGAPSRLCVWLNAGNGVTFAAKTVDFGPLFSSSKRTYRIELLALHPSLAGDADLQGLVGRTFADRSSWAAVNKLVLKTANRILAGGKGPAVFELGTLNITYKAVDAATPQVVSSSALEAKGGVHGVHHEAAFKKLDGDAGSVTTLVDILDGDDKGERDTATGGRV